MARFQFPCMCLIDFKFRRYSFHMCVSASNLDLLERNHQHFSTINEGSWSKTQIHVGPRACRKNDEAKTEGDDEVLACFSYRLDLLLAGLYTWNGLGSPRCWPACEEIAIDLQFADCMPACLDLVSMVWKTSTAQFTVAHGWPVWATTIAKFCYSDQVSICSQRTQ